MSREELLSAYRSAASGEEALRALDALAADGGELDLGALYDEAATRLAEEERFADAVTAARRALEHGYEADGREMLAWYLLRAGEKEEGEALWQELLGERPDDPDLLLTAGVAHRQANRPKRAAELLARAMERTLATSLDADTLDEAITERLAALQQVDAPAEAIDDHAERALARLRRQAASEPIAVPWYPAAEYAGALARLPGFAADWQGHDHASYSRELDRRLRETTGVHGHAPVIVPVAVDAYIAFAARAGLDPDWAETRARYADEHRAAALAWPPGRNDACWCGADAKYKRHCGA